MKHLQKAMQQPERVREVLDKVRADGIGTYSAVSAKLDQPLSLGYCNVGALTRLEPAFEGWRWANCVARTAPRVRLRSAPSRESRPGRQRAACFVVLSSIALQGVRLADPSLGAFRSDRAGSDRSVCVQLLRRTGANLGIDGDPSRLDLARAAGADGEPGGWRRSRGAAARLSSGRGVDGVLICPRRVASPFAKRLYVS